jgi:integrase
MLPVKATKSLPFRFIFYLGNFPFLQLSAGTDIYTVSKMLGHRELKTTQVYAKVVDLAKREAANRIKIEL